jgi:two-component sensor histidine kinase
MPSAVFEIDAAPPRERDLLSRLAAGTAGVVGAAFLRRLVAELASALGAEVAFVAELIDERPGWARTIAGYAPAEIDLRGRREFALRGTPCEHAYVHGRVRCPDGALRRYPRDAFLAAHALDGYLALVLRAADGQAIGHLGVISTGRLEPSEHELFALRIFAARAAAEVERSRHEAALQRRAERVVEARARAAGERLDPAGLERGLAGALAALAARSPIPLRIVALPPGRLPRIVEAAVWLLVSEALANTLEHAGTGAGAIAVEVGRLGHTLVAEVGDDGAGGARVTLGGGLQRLRARVEALGGRLDVDSPPGMGTRLAATIPLAPYRVVAAPAAAELISGSTR